MALFTVRPFCGPLVTALTLIGTALVASGTGCGDSNTNTQPDQSATSDLPGSGHDYAQTIIDSGINWQIMRITGAAVDDDGTYYDEVVYVLHGNDGVNQAPLPKIIKDEFSLQQQGDTAPIVHILHAGIIDEIALAEKTGTLSSTLRAIAEPLDDQTPDDGFPRPGPTGLFGRCASREISKSKTFSMSLAQGKTINVGRDLKTVVEFNFDASGSVVGEAAFYVKRTKFFGFCIPYGATFDHVRLYGAAQLSSTAELNGSLQLNKSLGGEIAKPRLGSLDFLAGPIPVHVGLNLPVSVGLDIDVSADASIHVDGPLQASGSFDYACTLGGCSGRADFSSGNGRSPRLISADAQMRVQPTLWGQVAARAYLYSEWLAYAQIGLRPQLPADLWGYSGNSCGDADGDGTTEIVSALTLDLDTQFYVNAQAAAFGSNPRKWSDLWHTKRYHLGFWDLLGSSAVAPMLSGTSVVATSTPQMFSARMRPCWPYFDDVNYQISWGDEIVSSFTAAPQLWASVGHTWVHPGEKDVQVIAQSDRHGRSLMGSTNAIVVAQEGVDDCDGARVVTLQPGAEGKDANVWSHPSNRDANRGGVHVFDIMAWTWSGVPAEIRGFVEFDLSGIAPGSEVGSAILTLYANDTSPIDPIGHSTRNGPNEADLYRVLSPWDEATITWNNQPPIDMLSYVRLPSSASNNQNYVVDVTSMVQDMINSPGSNHGFMVRLVTESYYRALRFWSSDAPDAAVRPRLEISLESCD